MPAINLPYSTIEDRWGAIVARDPHADGRFWYSVRSTGVFCRPSCASRTARRENVRFHDSILEARRAGFRPCKRCRPDEPALSDRRAALIAAACRLIETASSPPTLIALARSLGVSPHHLHRTFKCVTGLTPKVYASARRAERVRAALPQSPTVTAAVYEAGFQAPSRFYETAPRTLGMPAARYHAGGRGLTIQYALSPCSLGEVLVAATASGLCAVLLGDMPAPLLADLQRRFPHAALLAANSEFAATVAEVVQFIETPQQGLSLPLAVQGTAFQQRVWQALTEIPPGETVTYGELAHRIGAPSAVRAVATACAANPVAAAIPCHRVIRADGSLAGYFWGLERKAELLRRETAAD